MGILLGGGKKQVEKDVFSPASSFIETVEYDPEGKTMDITFHSSSKIRYVQVYPSTFQSFKMSPTHSAFYARAIKGNLQSVKIVDAGIGHAVNPPPKEKKLDVGLRKQQSNANRIFGTVDRALNAAVVAA